jgi:hypothetical protein
MTVDGDGIETRVSLEYGTFWTELDTPNLARNA